MSSITPSGSCSASPKAPRTCRTTATFSGRAGSVRRTAEPPLPWSPSPSPGEERSLIIDKVAVPKPGPALTGPPGAAARHRLFGHRGSKHDMIRGTGGGCRASLTDVRGGARTPAMTESHRLHAAQIDGASISPAGAFTVEARSAPPNVAVAGLSGELDIAATAAVRSLVEDAAGGRALVLDLSRVTFVDSSILKEL